MAQLELTNVSKIYGTNDQQVIALNEVSLTVDTDEIVVLVARPGPVRPPCSPSPAPCFCQHQAASRSAAPRSPTSATKNWPRFDVIKSGSCSSR